MGIPLTLPEEAVLGAFRRGWDAAGQQGFYIGRPHTPFTEVRLPGALGTWQGALPQDMKSRVR
jgi:hypothetical protein